MGWSARGNHLSIVAYASRGENIHPGELLASGTLPSGCGLELDRWIRPGNVVTPEIEGIGSVTNTVGGPESQ